MTSSYKLFNRASNFYGRNFTRNGIANGWSNRSAVDDRRFDANVANLFQRKNDRRKRNENVKLVRFSSGAMFFGLFQTEKTNDEDEISELITNIKRSILMIQREEYKKAEQMLHLALRQAQALQNYQAITYIYDVMANLAFDVGDYQKAESLFVSVMQRLISAGMQQDDVKIIHISLKMAKLYERRGEIGKAEDGYNFCLKHLTDKMDKVVEVDDRDVTVLWAMTMDWYARLLLSQSKHGEAYNYFLKAYRVSVEINGKDHEQTVVLLNDLGTVCFLKGDDEEAIDYFTRAAEIGDKLPDKMKELGSIHVNLGNVFIKKGLYDEAKRSCQKGWNLSKKLDNRESLIEASDCLDEINKILDN